MVFDEAGYRAALHKIDPSSCPDRFKAAWHDYLYAGDKDIGLGHRINALTALKSWQLVDPDAEVKDAWSHCESVAIEFGVDPVKAYAQ